MTETVQGFERHTHPRLERIRQIYFWAHLIVDFAAGMCFVVGSALFFSEETKNTATWLFLVGSILFAAKPTIRLGHELHRNRVGKQLAHAVERAFPVAEER